MWREITAALPHCGRPAPAVWGSALDPELIGEVLTVMQDLARSGQTMLVVSHEMIFVREVADRVVFMDGGVIVEDGPPAEVLVRPRTERLQAFLSRFRGVFGPV